MMILSRILAEEVVVKLLIATLEACMRETVPTPLPNEESRNASSHHIYLNPEKESHYTFHVLETNNSIHTVVVCFVNVLETYRCQFSYFFRFLFVCACMCKIL